MKEELLKMKNIQDTITYMFYGVALCNAFIAGFGLTSV